MRKIEMLKFVSYAGNHLKPGDRVTVPDVIALAWIKTNRAIPIAAEPPEIDGENEEWQPKTGI